MCRSQAVYGARARGLPGGLRARGADPSHAAGVSPPTILRMPKKWDVDPAITQAIIDGVPTKRILEGIRGGTLPLVGRPQALPDRTFYQSLDRCRRRLGALSPAQSADPLERLRAKLRGEEVARQE